VKLRHLEAWTEARRAHAAQYTQLLRDQGIQLPIEMPYARHVYHLYTIRTPQRDALQEALRAREIQAGIHYPVPVHLQPAYADLGYAAGDFPQTEQAAREVLLAQASDWAFLMTTGTAVPYAHRRFKLHVDRFHRLHDQVRAGRVDENLLREYEGKDTIFQEIDYRVFA